MAAQSVTEGNALVVEHETVNRGDVTTTADIVLTVDGTEEDREANIEIAPDETYRGVLSWLTETGDAQAADYDVAVNAGDRSDSITANVS